MSGVLGLEQFVLEVRTLSAEGNFSELSSRVTNFVHALIRNGQHLDNVLETLDLKQHSVGILAVLVAKLTIIASSDSPNIDTFKIVLTQLQEFVDGCNGEQVRFAPFTYAEMCHILKGLLLDFQLPICGMEILCRAIRKIQICDSQLTPIHADLCQLCLISKCFKPALEFLDVDITSISSSSDEDTKYFLLYFYYGGMIYTALKNYDRALYFFEVCVTTPAMAVSHIMLEAYKKYTIVSLILNGKVVFLPRFTNSAARLMKRLSQAYQELATAYATNNCDEVQTIIAKYEELFTRDHNLGLVKQVLGSLYKKNIQRLTNTFLTLSLTDVASRVKLAGPADAEKHILNMIEDGEIFATINQKDGMVIFHDDPEKYNSPRMLAKLEKEMATCVELGRKVLEMEEEVIVTPQYVRKACGQNDQEDQAASAPPINVSNAAQGQHKHNTYSM